MPLPVVNAFRSTALPDTLPPEMAAVFFAITTDTAAAAPRLVFSMLESGLPFSNVPFSVTFSFASASSALVIEEGSVKTRVSSFSRRSFSL